MEDTQWKEIQLSEKDHNLVVSLTPVEGKDAMQVRIIPMSNVPDLWMAMKFMMEAVGVTAASFSIKDNPEGITDAESMAQYISEYLTKVIMSAEPR